MVRQAITQCHLGLFIGITMVKLIAKGDQCPVSLPVDQWQAAFKRLGICFTCQYFILAILTQHLHSLL